MALFRPRFHLSVSRPSRTTPSRSGSQIEGIAPDSVGVVVRGRRVFPQFLRRQQELETLAAVVPPPRLNLVRYHGVLAPACPDRAQIVPGSSALTQVEGCEHESATRRRCHRVSWTKLLARVFQHDVTVCPTCAGHMKIVAALTEPRSVIAYLDGVGLPSRAPPIAPAHLDRQLEFDEAA